MIQELLYRIPSPKKRLWKGFTYIKYILFILFVLLLPVIYTNDLGMGAPAFCEYICPAGTLEGGLPLLAAHTASESGWSVIFREGVYFGCDADWLRYYLQIFLQGDVSSGSHLRYSK